MLFSVKRGDRVAQLILERIATPEVCLLACLPACLLIGTFVCMLRLANSVHGAAGRHHFMFGGLPV